MTIVRMVRLERLVPVSFIFILLVTNVIATAKAESNPVVDKVLEGITNTFKEANKHVPSEEESYKMGQSIVSESAKVIHGFFESLIPKFTAAYGWNPFEGLFGPKEESSELTSSEEFALEAIKQDLLSTTLAKEATGMDVTEVKQMMEKVFSDPEIRKEFKKMYKGTNGFQEHQELYRKFMAKVSIKFLDEIIESTTSPIIKLALTKVKLQLEQQLYSYLTEQQ